MRNSSSGKYWTNAEDEVLRAGIMKYGLNKWPTIASLFPKKTSKQCRARWTNWLDPRIKKTPWSPEEEEKLLDLVKMMPTQWNTIAPLLGGRTPAQCLEQYEKILERACGVDKTEDDPKRMRPGEIDPHPETHPARPDAMDMGEDEKEMISETKARLANTRGKKEKRRDREEQIQNSIRAASLRKKRELKASGVVETGLAMYKDTNRAKAAKSGPVVPLMLNPEQGVYNTAEEVKVTKKLTLGQTPQQIEKTIQPSDLTKEVSAASKRQEEKRYQPIQARDRFEFNLPEPRVRNEELKVYKNQRDLFGKHRNHVTENLVPDEPEFSSDSDHISLLSKSERIMNTARILSSISEQQTPLKGGENVSINLWTQKRTEAKGKFNGLRKKRSIQKPPNCMQSVHDMIENDSKHLDLSYIPSEGTVLRIRKYLSKEMSI